MLVLGSESSPSKILTLPETNILQLKIDPRKRRFLLETTIFRCYVSFREGKSSIHFDFPKGRVRLCLAMEAQMASLSWLNKMMKQSVCKPREKKSTFISQWLVAA